MTHVPEDNCRRQLLRWSLLCSPCGQPSGGRRLLVKRMWRTSILVSNTQTSQPFQVVWTEQFESACLGTQGNIPHHFSKHNHYQNSFRALFLSSLASILQTYKRELKTQLLPKESIAPCKKEMVPPRGAGSYGDLTSSCVAGRQHTKLGMSGHPLSWASSSWMCAHVLINHVMLGWQL